MTLGFDWAPENPTEPEGTNAGWQPRATASRHGRFLSVSAPSLLFFYTQAHTQHTFDCPPHTDNSQRSVIIRQEALTVRLNQLLYPSHHLFNLETWKPNQVISQLNESF